MSSNENFNNNSNVDAGINAAMLKKLKDLKNISNLDPSKIDYPDFYENSNQQSNRITETVKDFSDEFFTPKTESLSTILERDLGNNFQQKIKPNPTWEAIGNFIQKQKQKIKNFTGKSLNEVASAGLVMGKNTKANTPGFLKTLTISTATIAAIANFVSMPVQAKPHDVAKQIGAISVEAEQAQLQYSSDYFDNLEKTKVLEAEIATFSAQKKQADFDLKVTTQQDLINKIGITSETAKFNPDDFKNLSSEEFLEKSEVVNAALKEAGKLGETIEKISKEKQDAERKKIDAMSEKITQKNTELKDTKQNIDTQKKLAELQKNITQNTFNKQAETETEKLKTEAKLVLAKHAKNSSVETHVDFYKNEEYEKAQDSLVQEKADSNNPNSPLNSVAWRNTHFSVKQNSYPDLSSVPAMSVFDAPLSEIKNLTNNQLKNVINNAFNRFSELSNPKSDYYKYWSEKRENNQSRFEVFLHEIKTRKFIAFGENKEDSKLAIKLSSLQAIFNPQKSTYKPLTFEDFVPKMPSNFQQNVSQNLNQNQNTHNPTYNDYLEPTVAKNDENSTIDSASKIITNNNQEADLTKVPELYQVAVKQRLDNEIAKNSDFFIKLNGAKSIFVIQVDGNSKFFEAGLNADGKITVGQLG